MFNIEHNTKLRLSGTRHRTWTSDRPQVLPCAGTVCTAPCGSMLGHLVLTDVTASEFKFTLLTCNSYTSQALNCEFHWSLSPLWHSLYRSRRGIAVMCDNKHAWPHFPHGRDGPVLAHSGSHFISHTLKHWGCETAVPSRHCYTPSKGGIRDRIKVIIYLHFTLEHTHPPPARDWGVLSGYQPDWRNTGTVLPTQIYTQIYYYIIVQIRIWQ